MNATTELPEPGAEAIAHSQALIGLIRRRIAAAGGWVDFADFMELALYAPGLGYYSGGATKFGASGDFVTAPEISALFSRAIARAIEPHVGPGKRILEFGAGTGRMAGDMLDALAANHALPERYLILEVSADLRERQRRAIGERTPALLPLVEWLDELPQSFDGVIVANEVLDALPVSRFRIVDGEERIRALGVVVADDEFAWAERTAPAALVERVEAIESGLGSPLPPGFVSEVCPNAAAFMNALAGTLRDGICLLVDYGLPRRELYSPQRSAGTLLSHYRHRAHADAFLYPGLQDITAWVDFSAIAEAAAAAGLSVDGYTTQANFLIAAGIEQEFLAAGSANFAARLALSREMQNLLMPAEMGEKFKVMWLGKGGATLGARFDGSDQRHRL